MSGELVNKPHLEEPEIVANDDFLPVLPIAFFPSLQSTENIRMVTEGTMFQMIQEIKFWKMITIPVIYNNDKIISYEFLGELLINEIIECKEAVDDLLLHDKRVSLAKSAGLLTQQELEMEDKVREGLIIQIEDEIVDTLVMFASMLTKQGEDSPNKVQADMPGSILSANGDGLGAQVFSELIELVKNMDSHNSSKELERFFTVFTSFINHLTIPLDLKAATTRKLGINTNNRDFSHPYLNPNANYVEDSNGNKYPEEKIVWMYSYQNVYSKQLRKLWSDHLGYKVFALTDEMKEPFADMFVDLDAFGSLQETKDAIHKRFLEITISTENKTGYYGTTQLKPSQQRTTVYQA